MKKNRIPVTSEENTRTILKSITIGIAKSFNLTVRNSYDWYDQPGESLVWSSPDEGKRIKCSEMYKRTFSISIMDISDDSCARLNLIYNDPLGGFEFYSREAIGERGVRWEKMLFSEYAKRIFNCEDLRDGKAESK